MKRFLSIFAILAIVVSMFSGVGFAVAVGGETYTINNAADVLQTNVSGDSTLAITGGTADALNGYKAAVYSNDGTLQKKADGSDFLVTIAANKVTLDEDDVKALAAGTYTIKLDPETANLKVKDTFQYIEMGGNADDYDAANDAKIVAGTLLVKKAYNVVLDVTNVTYNENNTIATVPGKIINADSKALAKVSGRLSIFPVGTNPPADHAGNKYSIKYTDGQFEFKVYPSSLKIGQFKVVGCEGTFAGDSVDYNFADADYKDDGIFTIQYGMELADPAELKFEYPTSGQVVLQGVFNNEDAKRVFATSGPPVVAAYSVNLPNTDLVLGYVGTDNKIVFNASDSKPLAVASFANNKNFGFLFDGARFEKKGDIGLFLLIAENAASKDSYLLLKKGEVTVGTFETKLSKELPKNLGTQELVFTLDIPSKYFDKTNALNLDGYKVEYEIYKSDDDDKTTLKTGDFNTFDKKGQIKSINIDLTKVVGGMPAESAKFPRGEYTVVLSLKNTADVIQLTSSAKFEVVKANNYNLLGWEEDATQRVGDYTLAFNGTSSVDQKIFVKDNEGAEETFVEVIFNGCGLDNKKVKSDELDAAKGKDEFTVTTKETGILEATINVYAAKTDDKPAATFKREIKITGWNVTISSTKVTVGSEEDIVFEIVDEEGNSVNNAYIRLIGDTTKVLVDGRKTNINGGVYTYKEDSLGLFDNVESIGLEFCVDVTNSGGVTVPDPVVTNSSAITVVGKEVYTVTPSASTLLNGIEQKFTVEVLDENGDVVYPTFKRYDVDADGNESENSNIKVGSRKDVDGDGVKESVEVTVTANATQPEMIIRATTDAGKKMGEAKIEILKPVVTMTGAKNITIGLNNKLEFQLIDPRDNSVMSNDVTVDIDAALKPDYLVDFQAKAGEALDSNKEVWTGTFYTTKGTKYADAEKDDKDLVANIKMDGDNTVEVKVHSIPIVTGVLTSTPDHVIIGQPTNITLTYTDGDGNPLADREIRLGTELIGTTNEDGKVIYSSSATSSLSLVFNADTDYAAEKVSKKVSSKADTEAPKVEVLSIAKDGKSATLKITDNVRLSVSYVNGELVEMKFPKADAIHVVTGLVPGINKVEFLSADTNYNYTEQTIEIEVVAPVIEKIEVTLNTPAGDLGTPVMVGTTSMVPARLVDEFGVDFDWDAEAQAVEYTYGETTVQLTVGSKTGIVNGENKELSEAPYLNAQGRLMVPVRMVGQSLGFEVQWDAETSTITITK